MLSRRRNFLPPEDIRSISGASGGALNAILLGLALHEGQRDLTRKEIQAYLGMRDIWFGNRDQVKGVRMSLAMRKIDSIGIFHEIRLLKPGRIWEQGYPFSGFVDKLLRLGRIVVAHRNGFIVTYRRAPSGIMQIISEIDFESERVESFVIDLDALLFEAQQDEG